MAGSLLVGAGASGDGATRSAEAPRREPLAPSNRRPYSSGALRSRPESAAHKLCAHRLAVQDVALSRRKQGFDPPWARHRPAASSPDRLKAFAADVSVLERDVLRSRNLILVSAPMLGDLVDHGAADQKGLVSMKTIQPTRRCLSCEEGCGGLALGTQRVVRTAGTCLRSALTACARRVSVCKIPASSSADVVNPALPLVQWSTHFSAQALSSVNELKSATVSGQEPPSVASPSAVGLPTLAMRSSSSFFSRRAKKLYESGREWSRRDYERSAAWRIGPLTFGTPVPPATDSCRKASLQALAVLHSARRG